VDEARNGIEAIEKSKNLQPEVTILDVSMPGMNGIEAASRIFQVSPKTQIIFLTEYPEPTHVPGQNDRKRWAYVLKSQVHQMLVPVLRGFGSQL
jgi:CheY-like chemotaxis protein